MPKTIRFDSDKEFEVADIRKQGGLKADILELVLEAPAPDRPCERVDFLMCLQAILDRHLEDDNTKIDRSRTKQASKRL